MITVSTEQTSAYNWLEAISGDNGNIDPRYAPMHPYALAYINYMKRTYPVHQTTIPEVVCHPTYFNPLFSRAAERERYYRPKAEDINREDEIFQESRIGHWVDTNKFIAETAGLETPEEDFMETNSISSTETFFEAPQTALNLEAEPPFPTSAPSMSHQWASHNIYPGLFTPSSPLCKTEEGTKQASGHISDVDSCENALLPFCQPLRRVPSESASNHTGDEEACEPQWLIPLAGQVIKAKARGAIQKLRRKFSGDRVPQDPH